MVLRRSAIPLVLAAFVLTATRVHSVFDFKAHGYAVLSR